jgi:RNA polymerase sigma factor (sigma-70 family)
MLDIENNYQLIRAIIFKHFNLPQDHLEDLVQNTCLKIHKANEQGTGYDVQKSKPSTYIYMVAKGLAIKDFKRKAKWRSFKKDLTYTTPDRYDTFSELIQTRNTIDHLSNKVRNFKAILEEYTLQETCDSFNVTLHEARVERKQAQILMNPGS